MIDDNVIKILSQSIIKAAEKLISAAPFDKTESGIIKTVNSDGTYVVEVKHKQLTLKYNGSKTLSTNDRVCILIPQNNIQNAFIL